MEEKFQELIEKKLRTAKPLSHGTGLFQQRAERLRASLDRNEPRLPIVPLEKDVDPVSFTSTSSDLNLLQEETLELAQKVEALAFSPRPALAQALDLVCVWVLVLLFALTTVLVLPVQSSRAFLAPSVLFLFSTFYFCLLTCYVWGFFAFGLVTPGMHFQRMTHWPLPWQSKGTVTSAVKVAFRFLLFDSLWSRDLRATSK